MATARFCTFRLTPLLFWLLFQLGHISEGKSGGGPERAGSDTSSTRVPADVPSDPTPEEIMDEVELLSDLDILMDLEFLELLEMLEAENLSLSDSLQEETQHDSTGRN